MMEKVSVIVPTYGRPEHLARAIESVLNQTYKKWELIVVDDNNPDTEEREETEKVMQRYSGNPNIYYLQHPQNKNGSAARNTGLRQATGKYISFLDDDDEYFPERLQKCVEIMENNRNSSCGGVYTGCDFWRNGKRYYSYTSVKSGRYIEETLKCTFMLCSGSNLFVKADILRELNGFDETFIRHQDYEFLVRFFRKYELIAIPEVLLIKHQLNTNIPNEEKAYLVKQHYWKTFQADISKLSAEAQKQVYICGYLQLINWAIRHHNAVAKKEYLKQIKKIGRITFKERVRIWLLSIKYGH